MKHTWKVLALGGALAAIGCADSPTPPTSPTLAEVGVPATIAVPKLRGVTSGEFDPNAAAPRRIVQPDDPVGGCYDICEGGDPGDMGGDAGDDGSGEINFLATYTEVHWERDVLKGHAEMTFQFIDHANQEMSLYTYRPDGSQIGSLKFSAGAVWPGIMPLAQTLKSDGTLAGPPCDGRGFGATQHSISVGFGAAMLSKYGASQSQMMYQSKCQTATPTSTQTQDEVVGYTPTGLRICHRLLHYSSEGEYLYTETLYCYDTYAT